MSQYPIYPEEPAAPPVLPGPPPPPRRRTSGLAVAALVCGITGIVSCFVAVPSLLGLVLGIAALSPIRRGEARGRELAIAGAVLGSIGLILGIAVWTIAILAPSYEPLPGAQVTSRQRDLLRSMGVFQEGETIEMFYASGLLRIRDGGVLLTDGRLVIYGNSPQVQQCKLHEIARIEFTPAASWLDNSQFVLDVDKGRTLTFKIGGQEAGGKLFHRTLARKVAEARKLASKPALAGDPPVAK